MAIQVKTLEKYLNFGKAVHLTDGNLEVIIPVEIGPRIMHLSKVGKHNILEDDCPLFDELPNGEFFRNYGGHRVWHSPEAFPRSYMPDNDPLESYEIKDNGIVLIQKEEPWTQMKKSIELYFEEDGHIRVVNKIWNNNAWPIEMAVWGLTIGSRGGREICPVVQRNTGLLSNTGYRSWPYSRMNDPRAYWGQKYIAVDNDPENSDSFKLGYLNEYGWMAYFNHGQCFVKRFETKRGEKYPDGGCSYETITSDWGIELETLSPLQTVKPGKCLSNEEHWYVVEADEKPDIDEEDIERVMKPISEQTGIELPVVSSTAWDPYFEDEE